MILMEVTPPLIAAIGFGVNSFTDQVRDQRDKPPTEMLWRDSVEAVCIDWYRLTMNGVAEREITDGGEW